MLSLLGPLFKLSILLFQETRNEGISHRWQQQQQMCRIHVGKRTLQSCAQTLIERYCPVIGLPAKRACVREEECSRGWSRLLFMSIRKVPPFPLFLVYHGDIPVRSGGGCGGPVLYTNMSRPGVLERCHWAERSDGPRRKRERAIPSLFFCFSLNERRLRPLPSRLFLSGFPLSSITVSPRSRAGKIV